MWLNEGGQSAGGAAIDHLLTLHPAHAEAAALAKAEGLALPVWLANRAMTPDLSDAVYLASGLLVVPEFLGNRAPFANPEACGLIAGIGMDRNINSLTVLYVAGICGLGYGLRQIVDAQANQGAGIERILISGGAGSHDLVRQLLADATGLPVVSTEAEEPVLLGSAILGAVAGGHFATVASAMAAMSRAKTTVNPAMGAVSFLAQQGFLRVRDITECCLRNSMGKPIADCDRVEVRIRTSSGQMARLPGRKSPRLCVITDA